MRRIVTLLTDFGLSDPFVGMMKGVILGINPHAVLVDLCHGSKAYEPSEAAFALITAYRFFPQGTIHVAVIDPGVGGPRRPLLVTCDGHLFIGPDNGLLAPLAEKAESSGVRAITATRYFLHPVSVTFHGRDIFAPVAAHLSLGVEPAELGEPIDDYVRLTLPRAAPFGTSGIKGEILHIDRFGNLVTNVTRVDLKHLAAGDLPAEFLVHVAGLEVPIVAYYGQVAPGVPGAVIGSADCLEIFVNQGDASRLLGVGRGAEVVVGRKDGEESRL
ncbi:SAM-dependent chlorinase/fluorinase [Candidatus Methylomirabilis sp.]|uniref:SAM hydrolase/SAM-dependent halogenase family protein n=1 Tax=Candidatus Methylomirabilis sp. TaxID=2032687 RepID=UPI002A65956D|nr:SAM-dependent chlorinase/fluorinase [Candidatus Methylomirabilis sp.]